MNRHWYTHQASRSWLDRHGRVVGAAIIVASAMALGAALAVWVLQ